MANKILVPLAFSQFSRGIVRYAAKLAEALGSELILVNVISTRDLEAVERITSFGYRVDTEHYLETIKKERREELLVITEALTLPDEQVSFTFRIGDPTTELLKVVVEKEVDMVVMGTKTRDLRNVFTGSVAERMFRRCPVTIVSYRDGVTSEKLYRRVKKLFDKKH